MEAFGNELVRLENISKTFPGVKALKNVKFSVHAGEIHALVGENGAGQTIANKVLTGAATWPTRAVKYTSTGKKQRFLTPPRPWRRALVRFIKT